jgi:hypothetical protein
LTVPKAARLRRDKPKSVVIHREDIGPDDITVHEGMPVTTVERTVTDLLSSGERLDLIRQAVADARREGFIGDSEARRLRRQVEDRLKELRTNKEEMETAIP